MLALDLDRDVWQSLRLYFDAGVFRPNHWPLCFRSRSHYLFDKHAPQYDLIVH